MTDDRSLERAARSFIEPGPTRAPEAAIERALLLIDATLQERDLRIPRRFSTMPTPARVAAAAAIGVIAVGGALFVLGRPDPSGVGGPGRTGSPPATTAVPSSSPKSAATGRPDYTGLKGWIVFEHFGQAPDGSTATFDYDLRQIWLVRADGSGLHELAPGKPAEDGKVAPDISPDGRTVVFSSWGPLGRIWEVPIDGSDPTLLTTDCSGAETECFERDPAYSPDGKRIAFARDDMSGSDASSVIGIRDLASGTVSFIESTRVPRGQTHLHQPSWSPDGAKLAYHLDTQGQGDERPSKIRIEIVNVDGTGLRELPAPAGEAKAGDPDWSPDGSLIVFSTMPNREGEGDRNGSTGIFTIHPDGTGLTDVCGTCLAGGIAPSWTPDGKHILFWGYRTWALMDPDGGNMAHINSSKLTWFGDTLGYGYAAFLQPTP